MGDEAILQGIIQQLSQALPVDITVVSRDVEDARLRWLLPKGV